MEIAYVFRVEISAMLLTLLNIMVLVLILKIFMQMLLINFGVICQRKIGKHSVII